MALLYLYHQFERCAIYMINKAEIIRGPSVLQCITVAMYHCSQGQCCEVFKEYNNKGEINILRYRNHNSKCISTDL